MFLMESHDNRLLPADDTEKRQRYIIFSVMNAGKFSVFTHVFAIKHPFEATKKVCHQSPCRLSSAVLVDSGAPSLVRQSAPTSIILRRN